MKAVCVCRMNHIVLPLISIRPALVRNIMITGLLRSTALTDMHTYTDLSAGANSGTR